MSDGLDGYPISTAVTPRASLKSDANNGYIDYAEKESEKVRS